MSRESSRPEWSKRQTAREPQLSRDEIFELLRSRRRRNVLHALSMNGRSMSVSDLSRRLAAWENDREEGMVSTQERKRVYTALRQTHLPKLQSLGVIEYDADRGTVRPTPATAELRPYLRVPSPRPWPRYYGTLALLSSALVGALVLGWLPTWLTGEWVAAAVSLCLAILALLHSRETRPGHRDRQAAAADSRRGPGAGGESPPDAD